MTVQSRLLVFEPEPSLTLLLEEQARHWTIIQVATTENIVSSFPAHAALLACDLSHGAIATLLRRHHMIGPLFSLTENIASVPAPLIALPRPFRLNNLLAKLESPEGSAIDGAIIGDWQFDLAQRSLIHRDHSKAERLTDKEIELITLLLDAAPDAISRERLQMEIWRYHADASSHTVETHIWRLRQKLEDDPGQPRLLITEADGYRLGQGY